MSLRWVARFLSPRYALLGLGLMAASAVVLVAAVLYIGVSRLEQDRDAALSERVAAVGLAIEEAGSRLTLDAESLAMEHDTLAAVFPGLAPPATPVAPTARPLTDRSVDLVAVIDPGGRLVFGAPSGIALPSLRLPAEERRGALLGVVDGHAYVLARAPVFPPLAQGRSGGRSGTVLLGRRLEPLSGPLTEGSPRVEIAVLEGDALVWASANGVPPSGWQQRAQGGGASRQLRLAERVYRMYPVTEIGGRGVWALVPEAAPKTGRLPAAAWRPGGLGWLWLAGGVAIWFRRRRLPAGPARQGWRIDRWRAWGHGGNQGLEVLNAIAVNIGRSTDLSTIALETLAMLRSLTRVDMGAVYRFERARDRLVLLAQYGLGPEMEDTIRVRPAQGTRIGETVRTGRLTVARLNPVSLPDASVRALATARGHRTQVALPIMVREGVWGVMALVSREHRDFDQDEVRLLETVAHQVGVAVDRMSLYEMAATRLRRLEALREIETHISAQLDLERVLHLVATSALRLIGGAGAAVFLREGMALRPRAWHGMGEWVRDVTLPLDAGVTGQAVGERRGVLVNDYGSAGLTMPPFDRHYARVVVQPLVAGDRVLGVLAVNRDDLGPEFTADDLGALADFATPAAIAIGNARLFEESRGYALRLRALQEVNLAVSASLDLDAILGTLTRTAAEFFRAELATVWVADESGRWLVRRSAAGEPGPEADLLPRLAWGRGAVGWIAAHQMPIMSGNAAGDELEEYRAWAARHGLAAFTGLPLAAGGRLLGVLTLNRRSAQPLSSEEVAMLSAMAGQAAIAIDSARLLVEARRRAAEYRALFEVGSLISAVLDADRVLELIVERCRDVVGVAAAGVFRPENAQGTLACVRDAGLSREFVAALRVREGEGASGRAFRDRVPVWSADVLSDLALDVTPEVRARIEREPYRAVLSVPILAKGAPYGVLAVYWWEPHTPSASEVELLTAFAGQASIALENARLYSLEQSRRGQIEALAEIARELVAVLDPDRLLPLVVERAGAFFRADGTIFLREPTGALRPAARRGVQGLAGSLAPGQGVTGRCATMGRGVLENEYAAVGDAVAEVVAGDVRRVMAQPLVAGDRLLGVITMYRRGADAPPFSGDDLETLERFATQAAVALGNARLYEAVEVRAARLRTLTRLNQIISSSLDMDGVLAAIAQAAAEIISAPFVSLWVVDEETGAVVLRAASDEAVARALSADRLASGEGIVGWVAAHRQPLSVPDIFADERFAEKNWWRAHGLQSYLGAPILHEERLLGVLALWGRAPFHLGADDREVLESFVAQAAVAIRNARLYAETRRRLEETRGLLDELSTLHALSRAVTGQLDEAGVLEAVVQQTGRVLDARDLLILVVDESSPDVTVAVRMRDGARQAGSPPDRVPQDAVGLGRVVLDTGRPVRTDDAPGLCARLGITSPADPAVLRYWMGVPMIASQVTLGAVVLRSGERPFTAAEERLLANIADLAALALRSARLYADRTMAFADLAAAQDQLVRTEKLRALGEMASGVAHDFNNVLASIIGRAQLLLRHLEEPRFRRWVEIIERSALDGAQTVKRLQNFTRIRRDRVFEPVDLNEVVGDALDATESRWAAEARLAGIDIQVERALDGRRPHVLGDPSELREALVNLVLNALDAMSTGGRLTLRTALAGDRAELTVSDTGVGIPAEIRSKIFDPFFTTKGPKGTGLGLSMTYGILAHHEARITVDSEEGRGTTFVLNFPRTEACPSRAARSHPPSAPAARLRCLVVDDEAPVAEVLAELLGSAGHDAVVYTDPGEALARLEQDTFDAVFTDLSMPELSGWQVARAVKRRAPGVPVFLVTGFGAEVSAEEVRAHSVHAVLSKPLRLGDLLEVLAGLRPGEPPAGRGPERRRGEQDSA